MTPSCRMMAVHTLALLLCFGVRSDAQVWSSIGPSPLASQSAPPTFNAGRVSSIAVDPSDPDHWLAGFGNGGVWESRNAGGSWTPLTDAAPTLAIGALAFAPSDPSIIYAATGEAVLSGFAKAGLGILKSVDGGQTWSLLATSSFARTSVRRVRVHPSDPNIVLAITSRGGFGRDSQEGAPSPAPFGVLKSTDGGVSWTRTLAGQATALEIDSSNFDNQYAAIGEIRRSGQVNNDTPGVQRSVPIHRPGAHVDARGRALERIIGATGDRSNRTGDVTVAPQCAVREHRGVTEWRVERAAAAGPVPNRQCLGCDTGVDSGSDGTNRSGRILRAHKVQLLPCHLGRSNGPEYPVRGGWPSGSPSTRQRCVPMYWLRIVPSVG
jgi:hypothetical protein